jgi:cobaltochelatase CobN
MPVGSSNIAEALITGGERPAPAAPLLKAGLWHPAASNPTLADLRKSWRDGAPVAAICFYRALVQAGQTAPVEALCEGARRTRIGGAAGVMSPASRIRSRRGRWKRFRHEAAPDVVINATGFAVSSPGADRQRATVLESGPARRCCRRCCRRPPRSLGRIAAGAHVARPGHARGAAGGRRTGAVARRVVQERGAWDDAMVECNIVTHEPAADRVEFVAELAARWARLRRKQAAEKRVALVLANYPNRDGRIANGVGLDTPAGTVSRCCARWRIRAIPAVELPGRWRCAGRPSEEGADQCLGCAATSARRFR